MKRLSKGLLIGGLIFIADWLVGFTLHFFDSFSGMVVLNSLMK